MSIELSFLAYLEVYSVEHLYTSFVLSNFVFAARVEMFQQFVCFWIGFSCLNLKITSSVNHLSQLLHHQYHRCLDIFCIC